METKYMDATINRPHGDRTIDAPYVFADIDNYKKQLMKEEAWEKGDRNSITVFKSAGLSIVLTCLHKKADIEAVEVEGLLTLQVVNGSIEVTIQGSTVVLKKDQMLTIHGGIQHNIHARKESTLLLITHTG